MYRTQNTARFNMATLSLPVASKTRSYVRKLMTTGKHNATLAFPGRKSMVKTTTSRNKRHSVAPSSHASPNDPNAQHTLSLAVITASVASAPDPALPAVSAPLRQWAIDGTMTPCPTP